MRLEDGPRHPLGEEVSGADASEEGRSAEHRRAQERRWSRVAAITLALALSAASLAGLWLGFRAGPVDRGSGEAAQAEPVDLQPRVSAVVSVGPYPWDVAVGEGAVWVSVPGEQAEQDTFVVRVDSVTNEVVARIPVEDYVEELAAGEGAIWGAGVRWSGRDLSLFVDRIDPATNEVVARIPDVSGPLAVGEGALWAVDRAGARAGPEGSKLLRIDPATNQVVASIALGVAAWDIEFGEGYVWVLSSFEHGPAEADILQVDPSTNEVVARIEIPVPGTVYAPALGQGSAWVPVCCVNNQLTLVRVDVGTSQIVGEPIMLPGGAPFAVAAGHLWLVEERGALYGMNVATLEVDEKVSGFDWPAGGFPDPSTELDPDRLAVWVVNSDQDSVTRIDLVATTPPSAEPEPNGSTNAVYLAPYLAGGEGWYTRSSGPARAGDPTLAWASTIPFEAEHEAIAIPVNTIAALPLDGIVITVETVMSGYDPDLGPFPFDLSGLMLSEATARAPDPEEPPGDYAVLEIYSEPAVIRVYFGTSSPSEQLIHRAQRELDTLQLPPICPAPAEGEYGAELSSDRGAPGDLVTVSGPMPFQHEDGSYDTSGETRMIVWWNASPEDWPYLSSFSTVQPSPAVEVSPLLRLGEGGANGCSFSIQFSVPDVPPGDYPIVVLQESGSGSSLGSTMEASLIFHVS